MSTASSYVGDPGVVTSVMTSWTRNSSGQISRKLWQISNTFLLGAYIRVARGYRMVTSPMTSRDPMTSQSWHHNLQHAIFSTVPYCNMIIYCIVRPNDPHL